MIIGENRDSEVITLFVEGKIDTNTAPEFSERIISAYRNTKDVIVDFEKCDYVSSAGLRVLLIGQKTARTKGGSLKLKNVNDVLMESLKTAGFLNFMQVE